MCFLSSLRVWSGVAAPLLPQPCGTDSFCTSPTLNIGGDSKNSLTGQNWEKIFPSDTKAGVGPWFPFTQPAEQASSKQRCIRTLAGCDASVCRTGVLYEQMQLWAVISSLAFPCLSFLSQIGIIMLCHSIMFYWCL